MPRAQPQYLEGLCGHKVLAKVWRNGHSFKCSRRGGTLIKWWVPEDLEKSLAEMCKTCRLRDVPLEEGP